MAKTKLYKVENKYNGKVDLIQFVVSLIIYAVVLCLAQSIFKNFYIKNFYCAILASLILSLLNYTVKPLLIYWTLPLNILTYGIAYPIVNMIILKICDILMGSTFNISGFFSMFIIAIFISIMRIILDTLITNKIGRG